MSAIALTDHDTIAGLQETRKQAELAGIRFVNGVEINSHYILNHNKRSIHVLGYFFDSEQFEPYMMQLKELRNEHNEAFQRALRFHGIEICSDGMKIPESFYDELLLRKKDELR